MYCSGVHLNPFSLLFCWLLAGNLMAQSVTANPVTTKATVAGGLSWDSIAKEASPRANESKLTFTFSCTNVTAQEVIINRVDASCICTTTEHPPLPWRLAPNESGQLKVHFNGQGKHGPITKTILVLTSNGTKVLQVKANLPEPASQAARLTNQLTAQLNRQAVFQGECARCHVVPANGKSGEALFVAACGICHSAEHRASMVPDLMALKITPTKEYWEQWIRYGKSGSLMPAFEKKQGGPLTEEQIQSLVEFLNSNRVFSTNKTDSAASP